VSTFALQSLRHLFLSPKSFFLHHVDDATDRDLLIAAYLIGISTAQNRLDRQLIKLDLGSSPASAPLGSVADSWLGTWALLLVAGALSGVFAWYIGTWWYRVRLRWAGAQSPERERSRLVFLHAGVVAALPGFLLLLLQTVLYSSYLAAWRAEELWSAAFLVFPFWSVWASYSGVRARFDVKVWGARLWFLILPVVVYCLVFGLIGYAYSLIESPGTTDAAA
jgi:hypothetical protein